MNADQIASRLDGQRVGYRHWRCYCPLHHGHSLMISDSRWTRSPLVHCFGGCSQDDIVDYLKSHGLWTTGRTTSYRSTYQPPRADKPEKTDNKVLEVYDEARGPRSRVEAYLANRGITQVPFVLRFGFVWHHESSARLSAMVAPIEHLNDGRIGVHVTWLSDDDRKADIERNRKFFGHAKGGAVRLADPIIDQWLIIGEGIESTLSAMILSGYPGWAALSDNGIISLILPPSINKVMIAGDNDAHGVGQRAARIKADRFKAEGRLVKVVIPPKPDTDWNNVLMEDNQ